MQNVPLTRVEFKFDASDEYQELYDMLLDFDEYTDWIGYLVEKEQCLMSCSGGHELHLQLSFQYISNLEQIPDLVKHHKWYNDFFTRISLVLHGIPKPTSTMERLGLHVYSEKPQTLSVWSKTTGWTVEPVVSKQARIELLSDLDPFEPWMREKTDAEAEEVDWVALEDGNYHGMEGSGWDIEETVIK